MCRNQNTAELSTYDRSHSIEDIVDDVFNIGEEALDRVFRRRSIEPTTQPDDRVLNFPLNRTDAVDVFMMAVEKATHQPRWVVLSCSSRLRRGEHVELSEKLEGETFKRC